MSSPELVKELKREDAVLLQGNILSVPATYMAAAAVTSPIPSELLLH